MVFIFFPFEVALIAVWIASVPVTRRRSLMATSTAVAIVLVFVFLVVVYKSTTGEFPSEIYLEILYIIVIPFVVYGVFTAFLTAGWLTLRKDTFYSKHMATNPIRYMIWREYWLEEWRR
jgi:hypothetical protein